MLRQTVGTVCNWCRKATHKNENRQRDQGATTSERVDDARSNPGDQENSPVEQRHVNR